MDEEKPLVTLLTTQALYQKMVDRGVSDEKEQAEYYLISKKESP